LKITIIIDRKQFHDYFHMVLRNFASTKLELKIESNSVSVSRKRKVTKTYETEKTDRKFPSHCLHRIVLIKVPSLSKPKIHIEHYSDKAIHFIVFENESL
jgi:hypothetical protein